MNNQIDVKPDTLCARCKIENEKTIYIKKDKETTTEKWAEAWKETWENKDKLNKLPDIFKDKKFDKLTIEWEKL
jgi:hypothetical protein